MAIAHLQNRGGTAQSTTLALAYSSNVTAGSLLVAIIMFYDSTKTVTSVSGSLNGAFSQVSGMPIRSNLAAIGNPSFDCWIFHNSAAGAETVTVTLSASDDMLLHLYEFSGAHATAAFDKSVNATGSSSTIDPGNLTTAEDNEAIVAASINDSGNPLAGTGYTVGPTTAAFWFERSQYDEDLGAAGSKATAFDSTGSNWFGVAVAFKQAAATVPDQWNPSYPAMARGPGGRIAYGDKKGSLS